MKKLLLYLSCIYVGLMAVSCSEDEIPAPVTADGVGTFVDERDGFVYHYLRYGDQEWTCENSHYIIRNSVECSIYQPADFYGATGSFDEFEMTYYDKFGCLYSLEAAMKAAPEGWRLPTDEDWQKLERHFGMSAKEAASLDWRGHIASSMKERSDNNSTLGIPMGGYYTDYVSGGRLGWHYMSFYGYYWTATQDKDKGDGYYFARKFAYNKDAIWRHSMEKDHYQLYVRFVRDVK